MKHVTTDYGRLTIRLPALVHWVAFAWVRSSRVSARKMYGKVLWRWQLGHVVVMLLPRRRRPPTPVTADSRVAPWNDDKPHRCPDCHAIADPEHRSRRSVVTCCSCGVRFCRLARLANMLPFLVRRVGVVCGEDHR